MRNFLLHFSLHFRNPVWNFPPLNFYQQRTKSYFCYSNESTMKQTFKLPVLCAILSVAGFCCKKPGTKFYFTSYKGHIIRALCGNITVQCTSGENIGQMGWIDSSNASRPVYDNVFKVGNPCDWEWDGKTMDIAFRIVSVKPQNCAQPMCLVWVPTPRVTYPIVVVP